MSDIDVVQVYDAFTINTILFLEDLGFCAKGEGGPFVSGGRIAPGARADLVLVEGDPIRDIRATRAIVGLFKNGFEVRREPPAAAPPKAQ